MTRYTVVWSRSSQDDLAEIWINANDRGVVTTATRAVDGQLTDDASSKGIELSEGLRAILAAPLRVLYSVREDDHIVEVLRVKEI